MKYIVRLYRLLKPVAIYTSYLFTSLTILYLLAQTAFPGRLPFGVSFLWGIFFFSLGSILSQRIVFGSRLLADTPYLFRLFRYLCIVGIWGYMCLNLFAMPYGTGSGFPAPVLAMLLAGILCCAGLELFNRYRAHMYNTLLEQYKKRKQS